MQQIRSYYIQTSNQSSRIKSISKSIEKESLDLKPTIYNDRRLVVPDKYDIDD